MSAPEYSENLKERAFALLYGLLNESEAEELRSLFATDAQAAGVFEAARGKVEAFKEFTRASFATSAIDESSVPNVSVDFHAASPFAFDAAVGAFEEGVFSEPKVKDKGPDDEKSLRRKVRAKKERLRRNFHQRRRASRKQVGESGQLLSQERQTKTPASPTLFLLLKATTTGIGRLGAITLRSPLFFGLLLLLTALLISVLFGAWRRDEQLSRYFHEDFRIQVAIPRTLARGVVQNVVVRTTGVDGAPRRIPVRFSFVNPLTNEVIHTHTESGNNDGNLVFSLPALDDFPDSVQLAIFAGEEETESFKTNLKVVNFDEQVFERRSPWTSPEVRSRDSEKRLSLVSPVFRETLNKLSEDSSATLSDDAAVESQNDVQPTDSAEEGGQTKTAPSGNSVQRVFLHVFPETGKLVSGYVNKIGVYCSDKDGRPVSCRGALFQENSEKPVASFTAADSGFAMIEWLPLEDVGYAFSLGSDDDSAIANPFELEFAPRRFPGVSGTLGDSPFTVEIDPGAGAPCAFFRPQIVREPAYFSLKTQIPDFTELLKASVSVESRTPLVATVEKYGVTVWQRFIPTAKSSENVNLALPDSIVGLLKVSLYGVSQGKFQKIGETTVFRSPASEDLSARSVDIAELNRDKSRLLVQVGGKSAEQTPNENQSTLACFWAQDRKSALMTLNPDDVLAGTDVLCREAVVKTTSDSRTFNPPVVFDNLERLVRQVHDKLELFKENETKSFLLLVRLVFAGCFAIAVVSVFLSVLRAFSVRRCFILCVLAGLVLGYSYRIENSLDTFFKTSQDIVFAIDEEENERVQLSPSTPVKKTSESPLEEDAFIESGKVRLVSEIDVSSGVVEIDLDALLTPDERESGALLIRLDSGDVRQWTMVSLESDDVDESAE